MPLCYLNQPGNYLLATLLAGALAFDSVLYGFMVSIPFWCNFLQLFLTPVLARYLSNRQIFLCTAWANIAAWGGVTLILFRMDPQNPTASTWWFGCFLSLGCLTMAICGVAWTSWVQSWVPSNVRGVYFAKRNRTLQVSLLAFLVISTIFLDRFDRTLPVFCSLFAGAILTRIVSMHFAHGTPAPGESPVPGGDIRMQIDSLRGNRLFLRFVAVGAAWGVTANFVTPFYPLYLLRQLGFSSGDVGVFFVLALMFGALAFPAWGRLINRHGSRPVILCAIVLWAIINAMWSLVTKQTGWLAYLLGSLGGAANAGLVLGLFFLVLKLVPPHTKALAIGFNTAVTSLATALAPLAGGQLLAWCLSQGWEAEIVYRGIFLIQPLLALVTIYLVLQLKEPQTTPLRHVIGAMRNVRTLGAVMGLGFLFNYLFDPEAYSRLTRKWWKR